MSAQMGIILAIVVYLAIMIYVGFYFNKKSAGSTEEFYLGGRKL